MTLLNKQKDDVVKPHQVVVIILGTFACFAFMVCVCGI